ncbi:MAG TPA: NDP-sugar synthase [Candidatus Peribacteraceae bacterium]|nr:NDP-sugar synthase [Candidatus Peribacteraceae bacterium]
MHAFILAGGFATRLWPLTESRAKPLLPLAGKPMLTHIVEKIPADIAITVSTNAVFEKSFCDWAAEQTRKDIEIRIEETRKDDEKLGALGAVRQWIEEEKIADDVLLLTGDNYFGFRFEDFLKHHKEGSALIAAYDIGSSEKAKSFGTVIAVDGAVTGFEEKPPHPKSTLVSTGCTVIPASDLDILVMYAKEHPDNVGGIFEELLRRRKKIRCFTFTDPWFDVGSFEAYLDATKALVGNALHALSPESIDEESKRRREGSVVIGKDTTVRQSALKDTVVFEHCVIEDCVLDQCVIDNDCHLKGIDLTGKMIRAGTVLQAQQSA